MDNYGGYKLKPSSYSIQPNDIIIRVRDGISDMPNGQLAIALEKDYVKTYTKQSWSTWYSDWRAIETKPGSEAKIGDTVYCIDYPGGDCQVHDSFIVSDIKMHKFLVPHQGHRLLNGKIVGNDWCWSSNDFVVLIKAEEKKQTQNIVSPEDAKVGDYVIWDMGSSHTMTLGKAYEVVKVRPESLIIRNNQDIEDFWAKSRFKNIDKDQNQQKVEPTTTQLDSIEHLGYTMRIYSFSDEFTTQIPVVSTIKKTVVAKPAIKPTRKTKATEAT